MIIAIGGGEVSQNQTYEIDKFIVESSKKENPNFLFIPTASRDAEAYIEVINNLYEAQLTPCIYLMWRLTRKRLIKR